MLEDLKELMQAEPFIPFKIVLTSGSSYTVTSPFQIAIGKTQLDYYYPASDKKTIVRQNQIASFEVGSPTEH